MSKDPHVSTAYQKEPNPGIDFLLTSEMKTDKSVLDLGDDTGPPG